MDLSRLRFGDWVMGIGGVAVLVVMFVDWYEFGDAGFSAWESFAVNDVIIALAAGMAIAAFVLTAVHPTAAVPLALSSLGGLVAVAAVVLVVVRLIWTPDVAGFETARATGAWLGLVATTVLAGGFLVSIRDERLPEPENPVEPRTVRP